MARMHGVGKRVLLVLVSLCIAPVLGVWAGGSMPNPPGNGPRIGQLAVGVAVPVSLTFVTAAATRIRPVEAVPWFVVSLASTAASYCSSSGSSTHTFRTRERSAACASVLNCHLIGRSGRPSRRVPSASFAVRRARRCSASVHSESFRRAERLVVFEEPVEAAAWRRTWLPEPDTPGTSANLLNRVGWFDFSGGACCRSGRLRSS
jgi:hypothetical protein